MINKPDIYKEFYELLEQIPRGKVSTYGDMAIQLGDIIASRAVGEMLSENDRPDIRPCYRVVKSDGSLGGYTHPKGVKEKIRKLRRDGIEIRNGRVENFDRVRFKEFRSSFPLARYREEVNGTNIDRKIEHGDGLRALDISYSGRRGIGVAVDFGSETEYEVVVKDVKSPYIPNYLYLREGEIYESLVRRGRLNVIDGNGIIHRDRRGVATLVGLVKEAATAGLAKSLLLGEVNGSDVIVGKKKIGKKIGKYYVSRGYGVGLGEIVRSISDEGHFPQTKYPDRFSKRYRDEILPTQNSIR